MTRETVADETPASLAISSMLSRVTDSPQIL
jgi:hypothetical protein